MTSSFFLFFFFSGVCVEVVGYRYSIVTGMLKLSTSEDGTGQCRWVEFAAMRRVEAPLVGGSGRAEACSGHVFYCKLSGPGA